MTTRLGEPTDSLPVSRRVMNLGAFLSKPPGASRAATASCGAIAHGPGARSTSAFRRSRRGSPPAGWARATGCWCIRKTATRCSRVMFATFRLGAVWVPTNFRQTPEDVAFLAAARGASAFLCACRFSGACRRGRGSQPGLARSRRASGRRISATSWRASSKPTRRGGRERGRGARRPLLVFLHLGNHGAAEGGGADARADGLRRHQPSLRSHARNHRGGCLARGRAALARRRHPSTRAGRTCRKDVLLPGERFDPEEAWRSSQSTASPTCSRCRPS